jgi:hypothetical protein
MLGQARARVAQRVGKVLRHIIHAHPSPCPFEGNEAKSLSLQSQRQPVEKYGVATVKGQSTRLPGV